MITDSVIDFENAGYYHIFADENIRSVLNTVLSRVDRDVDNKTGEINEDNDRARMTAANRAGKNLPGTVGNNTPTDCMGRTLEPGMKVLGHGSNRVFVTPEELREVAADRQQYADEHPVAYGLACAAPVLAGAASAGAVAAAPVVAKTAVKVGRTAVKTAGNVATVLAAGVAANPKLAAGVVGAAGITLWLDKHPDVAGKLKWLWKNKVPVLATAGVSYVLAKTTGFWVPYFKKLKYSLFKGDYIARCDFTADGRSYSFVYDLTYNKWVLKYGSAFRSTVPRDDVLSFTSTKFAKQFVDQCQKYCEEFFGNERLENCMGVVSKLADGDVGRLMSKIFKNKDKIREGMYNLRVKVLESVSTADATKGM